MPRIGSLGVRLVQMQAVASQVLGRVTGHVGLSEQFLGRLDLAGNRHQADAHAHVERSPLPNERVVSNRRDKSCGDLGGLVDGAIVQQHAELVASEPRHRVTLTHPALEQRRDLLEQFVSRPVTGNVDVRGLLEVVDDEVLAVVPVHMHGIPCDMPRVLAVAQSCGAFVVEDCAQAAGAILGGRKVGTFGDAAFFSLGRGKGFTVYEGGIGVGQPGSRGAELPRVRRVEAGVAIRLLAMAGFLHPRLYWIVRALPLGWENETYDLGFSIAGMDRFRQGVALSVLRRLDSVVTQRRDKARVLRGRLRGVPGVRLLEPPSFSQPSYPWFPLLVEDRDGAVRRLRARGLGASRLFSHALNGYEYLRAIVPPGSFPGAEEVAARLLTLPTHEYVTRRDLGQMVMGLRERGR